MNRSFVFKGSKVPGVYQRCTKTCPADKCTVHTWAFHVELPAGPDGKRRQVTKSGFESGRKAQLAREEILNADRKGTLPLNNSLTFGQWLTEWFDAKVKRGELERTTQRTYARHISEYIVPKVGGIKMGELRGHIISRAYLDIMEDTADNPRPVRPATIQRIHAVVSGALKAAVQDGLIPVSPAASAKLPKVTKVKVEPPTPQQYAQFLDAAENDRMYTLFYLAGHTGLRRAELAGLRWSDINLTTGRLTVGMTRTASGYAVVEKEAKSAAGRGRVISLDSGTLGLMKAWRKQQLAERMKWGEAYQGDDNIVFTREDGTAYHPDRLTERFAELVAKAKLPASLHLHSLRHYFASALISSGCDIAVVSKMLGHANIGVTADVYGFLFNEATADATERAAALLNQARTRTA